MKDREGNVLENREEDVRKILADRERDGSMQIIKPETAQVMISMMQSVISGGTGGSASPGRPAAGKTGTTNSWKDAWFVGFTPQVTTGIWVGYDKMGLSLGINQSGGAVAAPIWGEYMRNALKGEPVLDFPQYAALLSHEVCEKSGLLPSTDCADTIEEVFVAGYGPGEDLRRVLRRPGRDGGPEEDAEGKHNQGPEADHHKADGKEKGGIDHRPYR